MSHNTSLNPTALNPDTDNVVSVTGRIAERRDAATRRQRAVLWAGGAVLAAAGLFGLAHQDGSTSERISQVDKSAEEAIANGEAQVSVGKKLLIRPGVKVRTEPRIGRGDGAGSENNVATVLDASYTITNPVAVEVEGQDFLKFTYEAEDGEQIDGWISTDARRQTNESGDPYIETLSAADATVSAVNPYVTQVVDGRVFATNGTSDPIPAGVVELAA